MCAGHIVYSPNIYTYIYIHILYVYIYARMHACVHVLYAKAFLRGRFGRSCGREEWCWQVVVAMARCWRCVRRSRVGRIVIVVVAAAAAVAAVVVEAKNDDSRVACLDGRVYVMLMCAYVARPPARAKCCGWLRGKRRGGCVGRDGEGGGRAGRALAQEHRRRVSAKKGRQEASAHIYYLVRIYHICICSV